MGAAACGVVSALLFLLSLGSAEAGAPQRPDSAASPISVASRLDAIVKTRCAGDQFMGSVLVAIGEQMVLDRSCGYANLEWQVPNAAGTRFRIGSLTKQFTAAAILLLEQRGRLRVEAAVSTVLPDAPAAWGQVSIAHLLAHTSGIPDFTRFPEVSPVPRPGLTVTDIVGLVRQKSLDFAPGEQMRYSNSGYLLLGQIIERVSGRSYAQFVMDELFTPIGMRDSGYDSTAAILPQRAAGYVRTPDGLRNAPYLDMSLPHAAGGLYSTTHDLRKWQRALFGGAVLNDAAVRKMTTAGKGNYGFGVVVGDGGAVIEHAGGINGFNTFLAFYPHTRTTVVVLANVNGREPEEIARQLAATLAR
jgi:CubicO group peptidase (beta-lactamase class C family)